MKEYKHIPTEESGRWHGPRGDSLCSPSSERSREILAQKGLAGIEYRGGEPDFTPVAEISVGLGFMTTARHSRGVLYDRRQYLHYDENGQVLNPRNVRGSVFYLSSYYSEPGNYDHADILAAEQWTQEQKDGHSWNAADIAAYRKEHDLTWHERQDMIHMDLVPTEINNDFNHRGGVSERKEVERIIAEAEWQYPSAYVYDDESMAEWEKLSEEEKDELRQQLFAEEYDEEAEIQALIAQHEQELREEREAPGEGELAQDESGEEAQSEEADAGQEDAREQEAEPDFWHDQAPDEANEPEEEQGFSWEQVSASSPQQDAPEENAMRLDNGAEETPDEPSEDSGFRWEAPAEETGSGEAPLEENQSEEAPSEGQEVSY